MNHKNRHFHSIVVHAVVAFSIMAAFSLFCLEKGLEFLMMTEREWQLLMVLSVFVVFVTSVPATISGIFETNKMYAKWHNTHKIKLFFSIIILLFSLFEFIAILRGQINIFVKFLLYFGNNILVFCLTHYGLKITLGSQSLSGTSYVPDFFSREKPLDILKEAELYVNEKPKRVDFFEIGEE